MAGIVKSAGHVLADGHRASVRLPAKMGQGIFGISDGIKRLDPFEVVLLDVSVNDPGIYFSTPLF